MTFKRIRIFAFVSFSITVMLFHACSFTQKTTVELYKKARSHQYDLIIVPGVPYENGHWSDVMKIRMYWSKFLYDKGIAKNVMYSGAAVYTPYVESEIMALYGEALGIPRNHIFTESRAQHSTENIYYSFKKAKKLGFEKIALASDPFQSKLLRRFTRKNVSPDVALIPIVYDTLRKMDSVMVEPEINEKSAYIENFIPITEHKGFLSRFRGTMGKNIDEKAYE